MRLSMVIGLATFGTVLLASDAGAIPAWARKYNMNCSGCHYPVPPRLNATGIRFRWAGYRMPQEIGEAITAEQVSNYMAVNGQVVFSLEKTQGTPATNAFDASEAALFFSGPFGRHYFGWFEFERQEEGTVGLGGQVGGIWGNQHAYGGFRAGQGHFLGEVGIAGFDRVTGFSNPLPLDEPLTAAVPFMFHEDRVGMETFYVSGRNRLLAQVLEPVGGLGGPSNRKDLVLTDQLLLDDGGGGLQVTGYVGSILGLDSSALGLRSNYWRLAATVSHYISRFELLGGVVFGQDRDLPTGAGSPFAADRMKGLGYWASGQFFMPNSSLSLFGRYEFNDPDRDTPDDGTTRFVAGGALPLSVPEYLRVALEYSLRKPQASGAPSTSNLTLGLAVSF